MSKESLEYYLQQMDGYLDGDLTDSDLDQFKTAIANDAFLKKALHQHVQARANIRIEAERKLKATFTQQFAKVSEVPAKKHFPIRAIIAALAILLLALAGYFVSQRKSGSVKNAPSLYAADLSDLEDPSYQLLRSSDSPSMSALWEKTVQSFLSKDYSTCLNHLESLQEDSIFIQSHIGKMHLMEGSCYLKLKQFDKALLSFQQIPQDNPYFDQRQWYEAITHYYSGNTEQAKESLLNIAKAERHYKQADAQVYLDHLK